MKSIINVAHYILVMHMRRQSGSLIGRTQQSIYLYDSNMPNIHTTQCESAYT